MISCIIVLSILIMIPGVQPEFDLQGHRGCRGLLPENTMPAMKMALDLGVTTLEMDAVVTGDNKVLISHEPWFNSKISSDPDGRPVDPGTEQQTNIFRMTYSVTQLYDVGRRGHPDFPQQKKMRAVKPLLADVIDAAEKHADSTGRPKPYYNIETKCSPRGDNVFHPAPDQFASLVAGIVLSKKVESRTCIQSFDFRTLKYIHAEFPALRTAMLIEGHDRRSLAEQLNDLGYVPDIYSPNSSLVTRELVASCHEKGLKLIPWTVNRIEEMKKLKALGVDGLISDYPDLYRQLK